MFPTLPRFAARAALVSMLALAAACGRGSVRRSDDSARTVAAPADRAGAGTASAPADSALAQAAAAVPLVADVAPARDADQRFLRQFADHYETLRQIAHAWMVKDYARAKRDTTVDPGNLDGAVDSEQRELLAVLSRLYGENYTPRPGRLTDAHSARGRVLDTTPARRTAALSPSAPEAMADTALAAFRRGTALVDSGLPKLRRREIRDLALRLRAAHVAHAKEIVPTTKVAR